jgi:hypothetical protein
VRAVAREGQTLEVKRALTDVARVVEGLGLGAGAKRQGRGLSIRCPAHNERDPSCSVTLGPDGTIRVRCFACDFSGDVFNLVAAAEGLEPRGADWPRVLERARGLAGLAPGRPALPRRPEPRAEPEGPPPIDGATFGNAAARTLALCPLAGSVAVGLRARGILSEAQRDGWGELPRGGPGAPEVDPEGGLERAIEALRSGFEASSLRWLFDDRGRVVWSEHRLLIPWRRPDGRVWGLQRRYAPLYGDETPGRGPKYVWPSERVYAPAERHAYGADAPELEAPGDLWLVEGAADVLALRALARSGALGPGVPARPAVLGLPGVETWKHFGRSVLRHARGRRVLVAFDADKAGDRAAKEGAAAQAMQRELWVAGAIDVVRRKPVGFKDWAELAAARLGFGRGAL